MVGQENEKAGQGPLGQVPLGDDEKQDQGMIPTFLPDNESGIQLMAGFANSSAMAESTLPSSIQALQRQDGESPEDHHKRVQKMLLEKTVFPEVNAETLRKAIAESVHTYIDFIDLFKTLDTAQNTRQISNQEYLQFLEELRQKADKYLVDQVREPLGGVDLVQMRAERVLPYLHPGQQKQIKEMLQYRAQFDPATASREKFIQFWGLEKGMDFAKQEIAKLRDAAYIKLIMENVQFYVQTTNIEKLINGEETVSFYQLLVALKERLSEVSQEYSSTDYVARLIADELSNTANVSSPRE